MIPKEELLKISVKSTEEERLYKRFHRYLSRREWFIKRGIIRAQKRGENNYTYYCSCLDFQKLFEKYFEKFGYSTYTNRPYQADYFSVSIYW
jgi:hypothetical protein